ncbi:MAG TPA: RNA polymerase sigma factor [Vicinamibacteria bacterium]|nr:RNA polymerase sigma factor [Vicinamibacteria bacterium]
MVPVEERVGGGGLLSATSGSPSDEELARKMFAGDEKAALRLVERYQRPLFGFLYRFSRNAADAEELFQETFLRAIRASVSYDARRRFKPWIYTIALNLARDRANRLAHAANPELRREDELPDTDGRDHEADWISRADLLRALSTLPETHREVIVLKYFEGLEEAEIAEACDIPRGTVKSRLHHGLRKLRAVLSREQS